MVKVDAVAYVVANEMHLSARYQKMIYRSDTMSRRLRKR